MKKKLLCLGIITSLIFTACGETSINKSVTNREESLTSNDIVQQEVNKNEMLMQRDIEYSINKGDTITPISEEPKIIIETDIQTGKTMAKLLNGEAKIVSQS